MATHDTRARLTRACRDTERAMYRRDSLLIEAHEEGISYGELARIIKWDRKSLTRYVERVKAERDAFVAEMSERMPGATAAEAAAEAKAHRRGA